MIKAILFIVTAVLTTVTATAQQTAQLSPRATITTGPVYADGVDAQDWEAATGQTFAKAKYEAYNSETSIKLLGNKTNLLALTYDVNVKEGELEIIVMDANGRVVFQKSFTKDEKSEMHLALAENQEYDVVFVGRNVTGSYLCKWSS